MLKLDCFSSVMLAGLPGVLWSSISLEHGESVGGMWTVRAIWIVTFW